MPSIGTDTEAPRHSGRLGERRSPFAEGLAAWSLSSIVVMLDCEEGGGKA